MVETRSKKNTAPILQRTADTDNGEIPVSLVRSTKSLPAKARKKSRPKPGKAPTVKNTLPESPHADDTCSTTEATDEANTPPILGLPVDIFLMIVDFMLEDVSIPYSVLSPRNWRDLSNLSEAFPGFKKVLCETNHLAFRFPSEFKPVLESAGYRTKIWLTLKSTSGTWRGETNG
jgi:hypothetical protein